MTAAVISLAACIAGALSLVAWLVYQLIGARSATSDEREDHVATRGELERVKFELSVTTARLADADRMVTALQEVLADAQTIDHGLDPADVRGRVLRAAKLAQARIAGSAVPAGAGEAVPVTAPAASALPALMPPDE